VKLAIFQGPAEGGDTLAIMERAASRAAAGGARLLILPEMFLTGYNIGAGAVHAAAQARDGAACGAAGEIARRHGVALLYGYPELGADGQVYNAALLMERDGVARAHYRKTQLFGDVDRAAFSPGADAVVTAEIDGVRLGILICYDVEFPELVRGLALAGADLIAVPTAQMTPFEFVPRVMIPARAYENSVFVAYANRCGVEGQFAYTGESCIAGPDGGFLARAGGGEELIAAELDPALLRAARRANTYLADRRPALYGALTR
jgi:predicted amidohydrolase